MNKTAKHYLPFVPVVIVSPVLIACVVALVDPKVNHRVEYVRDPSHHCVSQSSTIAHKSWDYSQDEVVWQRGETFWQCDEHIGINFYDNEEQP